MLLFALLSCISYITHASESEPDGWLADVPTVFRAGSGFACSMGATAAFIAGAYILAQSYKSHTLNPANQAKKSYLPPREFWWSITTGTTFIAALFLLTETAWSKQT